MPSHAFFVHRLNRTLCAAYLRGVGDLPRLSPLNQCVLDAYSEALPRETTKHLSTFLARNPYILQRVKVRRGQRAFFQQPAVLLVYFLSDTMPATARERWPLDEEDITLVFSDLGIAF